MSTTPPTHVSSGSSSPDSSRHSDQRYDSDTTPSPSGYRSPTFDPQALSTKLALYEASQSLSVAADTLAAAAQAISKAAASLALASDNSTTEAFRKPRVSDYHFETCESSPSPRSESPIWQQTSYAFPTRNTTSENGPASREDSGIRSFQVINEADVDVTPPLPDIHDLQSQYIPLVPSAAQVPVTAGWPIAPSSSQEGPKAAEKQLITDQNGVGGTESHRAPVEPETRPKPALTAGPANPSSSSNQNAKPPTAAP
ncbi:hypothetical protein FRC10_010945 [Ceratobasidium sp. 414]|nr:hypothetical protein FRC10_010945 [Ceratobasidium sp. 414]